MNGHADLETEMEAINLALENDEWGYEDTEADEYDEVADEELAFIDTEFEDEELRQRRGFSRPSARRPASRPGQRRPSPSRRPPAGRRPVPNRQPVPGRPPRRPRRPGYFPVTMGGSTAAGEGSEYVRWVQSALNQVANLRLPVDGFMGPATRSALRDFQQKQGLLVDGIAGPQTRDALVRAQGTGASPAPPTEGAPAESSPPGESAQGEFGEREMYEDELTEEEWEEDEWEDEVNRSSRDYIRWVQQSLNTVMSLTLAVDGIVGPMTASAVRSFQQKFGLTVDGIVGPQTEAMLISVTATVPPQTPGGGGGGSGSTSAVNTPLPSSGAGFYNKHGSNTRSYGIKGTIDALVAVGQAFKAKHPSGPRIGIGDISFRGGGPMSPHKSHTRGVDVDIRLPRNDGVEAGTNFRDPTYSRSHTQDLVNMIRANGVLRVEYIFFNDPSVTGVKPWAGHDDHLHVRFYAP